MGEVKTLKARSAGGANGTRYVRVTGRNRHGHVEFQFSIGDPDLFLEMTLPPAAFEDFCRENSVRHLNEAEAATVDRHERRWRYGDESIEEEN